MSCADSIQKNAGAPAPLYVAGWDGGGTKTTVEARTEDGTVLLRERVGSMNLNSAGEDSVETAFRDALSAMRRLPGGLEACSAVCIGSAGVSNPDARAALERLLRQCGYHGPLLLVGDHETALAGALGTPVGMVLIAGTGSICFGRSGAGRTARAGGYGHKIDDEGSGYALGRDALAAVVRAADGRAPRTLLTQMVFEKLGISDLGGLVRFTYAPETEKKQIASLAPLIEQARDAGDAAAQAITVRAADELVQIAGAVARSLGMEDGELAMTGSLLLHDSGLRAETQKALHARFPGMRFPAPRSDAASGAALLALEYLQKIRQGG